MDLVAIAIVKRAVGLDGGCGVKPYGETLAKLTPPVRVSVGADAESARECVIEKIELRPQGYFARFDNVRDRTAAEKICGQNVYLREDNLPKLDDGQYYHFHLKGMAVISQSSGGKIGAVKDTVNLPSTDALEITLANGRDVIIPYNDQAVVKVDAENRSITVGDLYIEELL